MTTSPHPPTAPKGRKPRSSATKKPADIPQKNVCSEVTALARAHAEGGESVAMTVPVEEFDTDLTALTSEWQRKFIEQLRKVPNITLACRTANVSRQTAYVFRNGGKTGGGAEVEANPTFAKLWDEALEGCVDEAEGTIYEEGVVGRERVTYDKDGKVRSTETIRDVNALKFYLTGRRREVYGEQKGGPPQSFETTEDAIAKALGRGLLAGIGAKLAERLENSTENEAMEAETL